MTGSGPIGLLGGTFDPIHLAHLRLAQEAREACGLAQVRFIPSASPPHRANPGVSAAHRLRMVELAVADNPRFIADDRELLRSTPSYTIDTVATLRRDLGPNRPLCVIVGADAFALFDTWKDWRHLLDAAHVIVATRPGSTTLPAGADLRHQMLQRRTTDATALDSRPGGLLFELQITAMDVSASRIREDLAAGREPRYLLPDSLLGYIASNHLYRSPDAG